MQCLEKFIIIFIATIEFTRDVIERIMVLENIDDYCSKSKIHLTRIRFYNKINFKYK